MVQVLNGTIMFIEHLQFYFEKEKDAAMIGVVLGLFLLLVYVLLKGYAKKHVVVKGLRYSLLLFALVGIAGMYNVYKNNQRLYRYTSEYQKSPETLVAREMSRMARMDSRWLPLTILWGSLILIGLVIIFFQRNNVKTGIALGLILIGSAGYAVSLFARGNANRYKQALDQEQHQKWKTNLYVE
jgi:hypothetical protein